MTEPLNCIIQGRTFISKSHPLRAVEEVLAGFACYEASSWVPGQGHVIAQRAGITDEAGALQWLRGETPERLYKVIDGDPNLGTHQP